MDHSKLKGNNYKFGCNRMVAGFNVENRLTLENMFILEKKVYAIVHNYDYEIF